MIIKGDCYALPLSVTLDGDAPDIGQVACAEVCLAGHRKLYDGGQGAVTWDAENQVFLYPLTQEETFAIRSGRQPVQLRLKLTDGTVFGSPIRYVSFGDVLSGEVL